MQWKASFLWPINMDLHQLIKEKLTDLSHPALVLDLESLEHNIAWIQEQAKGKKIRIATKSIRSVEVLKKLLQYEGMEGLMTFTLRESLWLREQGFEDILLGYPTTDLVALKELAADPRGITLMVDREEHLELIATAADGTESVINICLDLDLSMDLPGLRFGVYRSHLRNLSRLRKLLRALKKFKNIKLIGAMGYEAQIAGVTDSSPLIRGLKKVSLLQLHERRQNMLKAILADGHKLTIVNGGGSGSLSETIKEKGITEVTVGSAFYAPVLFDHYDSLKLEPALFFTAPVVRQPEAGIVTVLGGGYIASGSTDDIKQPQPYLPKGLKLLKHEGAGEVQTPLILGVNQLTIGDFVLMRHAKAAEVCERFNEIHAISEGGESEIYKTYRGQGQSFL